MTLRRGLKKKSQRRQPCKTWRFTKIGNAPVESREEGSYICRKKKKGPKRNSKQTDNLFRVMKGYGVSRERQIIQKGSSTGSH